MLSESERKREKERETSMYQEIYCAKLTERKVGNNVERDRKSDKDRAGGRERERNEDSDRET